MSTERKSLAVFADPKLRGPCSCFFFWKAPIQFCSRCSRLTSATLILQNLFLRYMFPHVYRMALGLEMKKGEWRSGFSHHCPCPVALGIKILIQVVWHHGKRAPNPVQSPWPLLLARCVTLGSPLNSYLSLFFLMCKTEGLCWSLTPSGSDMSIILSELTSISIPWTADV